VFYNEITTRDMSESHSSEDRQKHAETVIRNHVVWSMGAGLIPVLVADIFAVGAVQLDMIRQLCRVYEVNFSETQGKAIVTALTSSTVARITAGSVAKMIPVVGTFLGGVTVSVFAGASTYALGEVFKKHFELGGTILDFDPDRLKKLYKEKFEKGKKVAEELVRQQKAEEGKGSTIVVDLQEERKAAAASGAGTDVVARLKELAALKEQGILTEEEFERMKKRLLEQF
jgi:uncharacterized protein (DUF697 family)